jgi:hypothetical protein
MVFDASTPVGAGASHIEQQIDRLAAAFHGVADLHPKRHRIDRFYVIGCDWRLVDQGQHAQAATVLNL